MNKAGRHAAWIFKRSYIIAYHYAKMLEEVWRNMGDLI